MLQILIADDHPLFRQAMQLAVADLDSNGSKVVEASTIDEVECHLRDNPELDLLLLDLKMPGMEGLTALVELRRRFPHVPIVIVSATEDVRVMREAMACGAMGYIPKSLCRDAITEALSQVLAGQTWLPEAVEDPQSADAPSIADRIASLTPQQLKVLRLMVDGKPNKIIAFDLDIAETTVKAHITVILRKLGVHSRTQAVLASRDFFAPAA